MSEVGGRKKMDMETLEEQLSSFDGAERRAALQELLVDHGDTCARQGSAINMHCHSFFSYNAFGWSPSRIVWQAKKSGLYATGLCDFDVLDGLEEFLAAGRQLGVRCTASVETRAFLNEYSDAEISSPGEPGVTYIMGAGFPRVPLTGTEQADGLAGYRQRANERNVALISRINPHVPNIAIDYEQDVKPLAPEDAPTERHIVTAYVHKARDMFGSPAPTAEYWSKLLGKDLDETVALLADVPAFEGTVRSKLCKRGGLGYIPPSTDTFPPVDDFIDWVASCSALPMITWLDGTSDGEKDGRAMLECMTAKGAVAINIIPDRNWNISDPETRDIKVRNLSEIISISKEMGLPVNIGTEMNKADNPLVDDMDADAMSPHSETFLRGARIMVGHTVLARYANFSYIGEAANAEFDDVGAKNDFFEAVGALPAITEDKAKVLENMGPEKTLAHLRDSVQCRKSTDHELP